jgi:3-hydroxyisobutyrate dehydrogenase-like beta-hydroxyacid dehydrogenase
MADVAFVGLGVMGFPMAGHLAAKGHTTTVFNRTPARAESWCARFGGSFAATPAAAATDAEIVAVCVGNDADLRSVVLGPEGILAGLAPGGIVVDHTTASAEVARELAAVAAAQGKHFIDAPVSGGQAGAENGALTIMCGGETEPFSRAEPVLRAYGRAVTLMGPSGAGQLTKMVNQICIGGLLQALSEAIVFTQRAGLDPDKVLATISKGAAQSWQMENRWATMAAGKFDFGFAVDLMRKDLGIVLDEARRNGTPLPVTALIDQFYRLVQECGGGKGDTSSLILNLRQGSGAAGRNA